MCHKYARRMPELCLRQAWIMPAFCFMARDRVEQLPRALFECISHAGVTRLERRFLRTMSAVWRALWWLSWVLQAHASDCQAEEAVASVEPLAWSAAALDVYVFSEGTREAWVVQYHPRRSHVVFRQASTSPNCRWNSLPIYLFWWCNAARRRGLGDWTSLARMRCSFWVSMMTTLVFQCWTMPVANNLPCLETSVSDTATSLTYSIWGHSSRDCRSDRG